MLVIGPCGAGKSTLSTVLGDRLGLSVTHLDQLHWHPGWVEGSPESLREEVRTIVATERWLIDANYGGTLDERLPRADAVICLDFPISLCLWRVVKRIITHRGRSRPDMTAGCPERFDLPFFGYLPTWKFGPGRRTEARLKGHERKIVRLASPKALAAWLRSVEAVGR